MSAEMPIRIKEQASTKSTKRNFPLTTSFLATGSNAEKTMSLASLANWKLWNNPSVKKKALHRIGYPGIMNMNPKAMKKNASGEALSFSSLIMMLRIEVTPFHSEHGVFQAFALF